MRETKHTGGLMEIHYPKNYKPERTEADEMRSKSIKEYYKKEAIKKEQKERNQRILVVILTSIIVILLILKIIKII